MPYTIRTTLALVALIAMPALAGHAAEQRRAQENAPGQAVQERPAKDCTRLNSRYGYYANPWCTEAEQERWDRLEARRLSGRR